MTEELTKLEQREYAKLTRKWFLGKITHSQISRCRALQRIAAQNGERMIPSIESLLEDYKAGNISLEEAMTWISEHLRLVRGEA